MAQTARSGAGTRVAMAERCVCGAAAPQVQPVVAPRPKPGPCKAPCCSHHEQLVTFNGSYAPSRLHPSALVAGASALLAAGASHAEEAMTAAAGSSLAPYVPTPYEPGWEIWAGAIAGVIPFAIGSYEFGKRILIQLRCELCAGKGLVPSTNAGAKYLRKCPQCGGFFPWISWKLFLTSTAAPGNGGPLQQPKGQSSVLYRVPESMPTQEQVAAARERYMSAGVRARQEGGEESTEGGDVRPQPDARPVPAAGQADERAGA